MARPRTTPKLSIKSQILLKRLEKVLMATATNLDMKNGEVVDAVLCLLDDKMKEE